jgi:hypothetical protein
MKNKNKSRSILSILAICASVVSACICVLLLSGDYHTAQFKMDTCTRELEGWEACRRTNLDYYKANEKAVNSCLASLDEAKDNFWVKLSKPKLASIFVLATLVSASGGYLVSWAILWFIGFGVFKFIKSLVLYRNLHFATFSRKGNPRKTASNKEPQNKYNLHSFAKPQKSHA